MSRNGKTRIAQSACKLCVVALFLYQVGPVGPVVAYEISTHALLTRRAVGQSNLATEAVLLPTLGLEPLAGGELFPDASGIERIMADHIATGSQEEDLYTRPLNHFYDPYFGRNVGFFLDVAPTCSLFPEVCLASPFWALEIEVTHLTQAHSLRDARAQLRDALTDPDPEQRQQHFARMFKSLGHVIHHVQDMAQPEHPRLDPHLGLLGFDMSPYERYARVCDRTVLDAVPTYSPTFSPDDFRGRVCQGVEKFRHHPSVRDPVLISVATRPSSASP